MHEGWVGNIPNKPCVVGVPRDLTSAEKRFPHTLSNLSNRCNNARMCHHHLPCLRTFLYVFRTNHTSPCGIPNSRTPYPHQTKTASNSQLPSFQPASQLPSVPVRGNGQLGHHHTLVDLAPLHRQGVHRTEHLVAGLRERPCRAQNVLHPRVGLLTPFWKIKGTAVEGFYTSSVFSCQSS